MNVVRDPVSRRGQHDAELGRRGLEEPVVVRVLEIGLNDVVVDVADGQFGLYPRDPQGFEGKVYHGPRRVLGERLIDSKTDLPVGPHLSVNQM